MFRHSGFALGILFGVGIGLGFGACASSSASTVPDAPLSIAKEDVTAESKAAKAAVMPTVMAKGQQAQRRTPNGKASITFLAKGEKAFLGKLEMVAGGAVPEHRDSTEEYIYILEGGGEMMIDDIPYEVGPGAAIFMPANAKVSFKGNDTPLVALQVFAGPGPASKYDAWTPVD